jgi:hypothetical protein
MSNNVSLSLVGVRNVDGKQDIVPDVGNSCCTQHQYVKSADLIFYAISSISVRNRCNVTAIMSVCEFFTFETVDYIEEH